MRKLSRRDFVRLGAAGLGALAGLPVLSGCSRATDIPIPSATLVPSPTSAPTIEPSATPAVPIQVPETASRVVRAGSGSLWKSDGLAPDGVSRMLDASISKLTGMTDAPQAWKSLFRPGEKVAIKVNAIINGSTHVPLVMAVVERLQSAGIAPENITIYDRATDELTNAGFHANQGGKGVQCYGHDFTRFATGYKISSVDIRLAQPLVECDALINMPVLKAFTFGGISFAMKNHYGSFDSPSLFHDSRFPDGITGINGLPPVKDRTRLIIGDILAEKTHQDYTNYAIVGGIGSILMSIDTVAVDAVGRQMACQAMEALGNSTEAITALSDPWLAKATEVGLGASDTAHMELIDLQME